MIVRMLLAGILAGILAGAFATAAQSVKVWPLIVEAEKYEGVETSHDHGGHDHGSTEEETAAEPETGGHSHSHDGDAWAPHDGFERNFYSFVSNAITGIAYSLILTAVILISGQSVSFRSGLVWGAAGFVCFMLAPSFGLPPELPGMVSASVNERQFWWTMTVLLSAGGLYLFAFKTQWYWMLAGLGLLMVPHLYGAPVAPSQETAVPAHVAAEFVVAAIVTSALFWLFLGGVLGSLLQRVMRDETS